MCYLCVIYVLCMYYLISLAFCSYKVLYSLAGEWQAKTSTFGAKTNSQLMMTCAFMNFPFRNSKQFNILSNFH